MKKLTLTDLWLVLDNIVRLRVAAVMLLAMGGELMEQIQDLHGRIGAIPGVRDGRRPFAEELADEDEEHDLYGRAVDLLLQFYESLEPKLSDEINRAVREVRKTVIGNPGDLQLGYIDEAVNARRRRAKLPEIEEALLMLPVAGIGSCKELAEAYTGHGEQVDALLNQRGDAEAITAREAGALRMSALSLLTDVQDSIRIQRRGEARMGNRKLPDNVEALIFGYANALVQLRTGGNTSTTPDDNVALDNPIPTNDPPTPPDDPAPNNDPQTPSDV